ncbi:beta-galactosidase family protein [Paenibacillus sp. FJAT-26967]|uniref:glycoside hydrolase family 35 protein n=1 Tax=Paenibacillus sp. FJAT-26967 TaxID=1729690 RepID=UPI0008381343|nr:beta-galactosidase [Paenibacillus sp. FJAT-26967]
MTTVNFGVQGKEFVLDGQPIQLISGAIHYFRVVPEYWRDRLMKLQAGGCNTVETYVAWNVHEPEEGKFDFSGIADVVRFVEIAGELGLHVIVRPSPYICAEWEFGGLPAWLLKYPDMLLRCSDPLFLAKVDAYYDELLPKFKPLLCTNGGPIIAMQVENEYGSYGNDKDYLRHIKEGMISRGMDVLLFTSDGPSDEMLQGGTLPEVLATVNFGSRVQESFAKFREYRPDEPLMCMEYWNGWFDHWMEDHHTRDAEDAAQVLDEMLGMGASVNFYMFHGGTNFGFYSGANHIKTFEPTVTSYDYDAALTERGDPTVKFESFREVIRKYAPGTAGNLSAVGQTYAEEIRADAAGVKDDAGTAPGSGTVSFPELPESVPARSYGEVRMTARADLLDQLLTLSQPVRRAAPEPMEKLGQNYGYILYSARVSGPRSGQELHIQDVRDRAQVFLDGTYIGVVERWDAKPLKISIPAGGARLDILVENMGRVNYGPLLRDHKGITEGVRIDNQFQYGWDIYTLPLLSLDGLEYSPLEEWDSGTSAQPDASQEAIEGIEGAADRPAFYRGYFEAEETADTFLRLDGWNKGAAFINGFNLGRYWKRGPQNALYLPGPLLRNGRNELVIFELHAAAGRPVVTLDDKPDLGIEAAVDQSILNFTGE